LGACPSRGKAAALLEILGHLVGRLVLLDTAPANGEPGPVRGDRRCLHPAARACEGGAAPAAKLLGGLFPDT
jgi:hypothetical protein